MMFATDLDRTIIYSNKALEDLGPAVNDQLYAVEKKADSEIAFMTKKAFSILKEISQELLLVPVTTRTTSQFKRIFIFGDHVPVKYAITFNGAEILYEGKPLPDWRESISDRLKQESSSLEELKDTLQNNICQVKGELKSAEGLFLYYLLEERLSASQIQDFKRAASSYGWRISYQGRKLYFMPNPISKGEAVSFVKEREGIHTLIGAGDSLLDEDFLVKCDHSFIPAHGELAGDHGLMSYIFTKNRGAYAGEELLESVNVLLKKGI